MTISRNEFLTIILFVVPQERFGQFIIDEAEVDDEVEDDDEWEDGAHEMGVVGNEIEEFGTTAREIENRRRANLWE